MRGVRLPDVDQEATDVPREAFTQNGRWILRPQPGRVGLHPRTDVPV